MMKPGRALLDDEGGDAALPRIVADAGHDDDEIGGARIADPDLAAVQHPLVALQHRAGLHGGGIAAGAGLGDRDRGDSSGPRYRAACISVSAPRCRPPAACAGSASPAAARTARRSGRAPRGPQPWCGSAGHDRRGPRAHRGPTIPDPSKPSAAAASARRSVPDDRNPAAWISGNAARAGSARGRRISRPSRGSSQSLHRCSSTNPLSPQTRHNARNRHWARDRSEPYWPESCRRDSPWRRRS